MKTKGAVVTGVIFNVLHERTDSVVFSQCWQVLELCRKAELFLLTSSFEPCYFQVAISERFQCPIRQSKDDSGSHAMKLQKSNKRRKFILLQVQTNNKPCGKHKLGICASRKNFSNRQTILLGEFWNTRRLVKIRHLLNFYFKKVKGREVVFAYLEIIDFLYEFVK